MWFTSSYTRPDIRCTFAAMRRCDALFGRDTQHADECRSGARDAHLLDYAFGRSEAYRVGRTTTLTCPPSLDEAVYGHYGVHHGYYGVHASHASHCPHRPRYYSPITGGTHLLSSCDP